MLIINSSLLLVLISVCMDTKATLQVALTPQPVAAEGGGGVDALHSQLLVG